jgi:hypothetical protein
VHEESDDIRERNPAPHQIRGYLSDFSQMTLEVYRQSLLLSHDLIYLIS